MRPITDQIAGRLPMHRAIRARVFGVAALILLGVFLIAVLSACGGTGPGGSAESDPASGFERDRESWKREQREVAEKLQLQPDEPYWPHRMAEIQVALDSTARASESLDRALALDPDHTPSLLLRSKLYYETARYEDAVSLLEAALSRHPLHADALRMALAINLEALGEIEVAEQQLAQCEQNPTQRRGVETFLSLRGDGYLESEEIAKAALHADPQSASNHNNYGVALLYAGDPEAARSSFLNALELDPALAGALYNLAIVETYYFYDLEKGRAWFERYAQLETEDPDELGAVFGVDLASRGIRATAPVADSADKTQEGHDAH